MYSLRTPYNNPLTHTVVRFRTPFDTPFDTPSYLLSPRPPPPSHTSSHLIPLSYIISPHLTPLSYTTSPSTPLSHTLGIPGAYLALVGDGPGALEYAEMHGKVTIFDPLMSTHLLPFALCQHTILRR